MVSQGAASIVSSAAGIVGTGGSSDGSLGQDITTQLLTFPKMLYVTGATILCLGSFTPINDVLTIPIAGLLIFAGYPFSNIAEMGIEQSQGMAEEIESDE